MNALDLLSTTQNHYQPNLMFREYVTMCVCVRNAVFRVANEAFFAHNRTLPASEVQGEKAQTAKESERGILI